MVKTACLTHLLIIIISDKNLGIKLPVVIFIEIILLRLFYVLSVFFIKI